MNFRLRLAAWSGGSLIVLVTLLVLTAHHHLGHELRREKWERSHPQYPNWVLHGSYTDEEIHDILGELLHAWAVVGIPALLLALGGGLLLATQSIRPIRRINEQLARVRPETLKAGVTIPEHDPALAELVGHLNDLLRRMGQAYDDVSEYASRVAHELRTPLALLRLRIEQAAGQVPPELSESLQVELARLSQFVERALLAAQAQAGRLDFRPTRVDVSALLADLREGYDILAAERTLSIEWRVQPGLVLTTDDDLLRLMLHNVLGNALRYGSQCVRVRAIRRPQGVRLTCCNRLDAARRAPSGPGLGLRLVRSLVTTIPGAAARIRERPRSFGVQLTLRETAAPTPQPAQIQPRSL